MVSAEEKAANIIEKCGLVDNLLREIDINDEIRNLEEIARANRPTTAKLTEPLTRFLPSHQAKRLEELRREKLVLKDKENKGIVCARGRIAREGIKLVKTKKGTFAIESQPNQSKEEKNGLAVLFGER